MITKSLYISLYSSIYNMVFYAKIKKNKSSGVLYIYIDRNEDVEEGDNVRIEKVE